MQPEFEVSPGLMPEIYEQEVPSSVTPLTQALRLDPDRLDGIAPPRANRGYDECVATSIFSLLDGTPRTSCQEEDQEGAENEEGRSWPTAGL